MRQVGGLAILSSLLQRLMRPGVTDIYQLRVSVCMALKLLVEGELQCMPGSAEGCVKDVLQDAQEVMHRVRCPLRNESSFGSL